MDTGVVIARELVSELDCHAHDTVSAMSYRDRSASAVVNQEAIEIKRNCLLPELNVPFAVVVTVTCMLFIRLGSVKALVVITFVPSCHDEDLFPAVFELVGNATVIVDIIYTYLPLVKGKSIRGGGKDGKC